MGLVFASLMVYLRRTPDRGKKRKNPVVNAFRMAGGILLGTLLLGVLIAATGEVLGTIHGSRLSPLTPTGNLVLSLASVALIAALMRRWAKYFAAWLGLSCLRGIVMALSGHLYNNLSIPVSRFYALVITAITAIAALVSARFVAQRSLSSVDKAALMMWIIGFDLAINFEQQNRMYALIAYLGSCIPLVLAWLYHRSKYNRHQRGFTPIAT